MIARLDESFIFINRPDLNTFSALMTVPAARNDPLGPLQAGRLFDRGLKALLGLLLLALLAAGPGHGYGLIAELRGRSGGFLRPPAGSIYPALHQLEESGLIRSRTAIRGRERRTNEITAGGKSWRSGAKSGGDSQALSRAFCERTGIRFSASHEATVAQRSTARRSL